MYVYDKELLISHPNYSKGLLEHFRTTLDRHTKNDEMPIRFVVTHSDEAGYHCEVSMLVREPGDLPTATQSIFDFQPRSYENTDQFNAVLLIPTGINCEIGGEAGDATPIARLLAPLCDHLVLHPNVVNASDINELPENCLYVEGSVICRLMMGALGLQKVRSNRILLTIEEHDSIIITEASINAASAARATLGMNCTGTVRMKDCFHMSTSYSSSGRASGRINGLQHLCEVLRKYRSEYDAIAITSLISLPDVPEKFLRDYYSSPDKTNPWGGIEAMLTHAVSTLFNLPSAHSPMMETPDVPLIDLGLVDPRKAAEAVSRTYLHCILKGLHRSPKLILDPIDRQQPGVISAKDISCLVIPDGCLGLPTLAALEQGIPVIAVRGNKNLMRNRLEDLPFRSDKLFFVDNYLEAAGIMTALKAGVEPSAIQRPLPATKVATYESKLLAAA